MPTTFKLRSVTLAGMLIILGLLAGSAPAQSPQTRRGGPGAAPPRGVYKMTITPHWFHNNTRFWYRNDLTSGTKEFVLVDAEKGTRLPAFDHEKLAAALTRAAGQAFKANRLPFQSIDYIEDGKSVKIEAASKSWKCDLTSYACALDQPTTATTPSVPATTPSPAPVPRSTRGSRPAQAAPAPQQADDDSIWGGLSPEVDERAPYVGDDDEDALAPQAQAQGQRGGRGGAGARGAGARGGAGMRGGRGMGMPAVDRAVASPDGKWTALIKNNNVFIRAREDAKEYQLSQDGNTSASYGRLEWAPDSQGLVSWRYQPGADKIVYRIRTSPPAGGRAILESSAYSLPGDRMPSYELSVFNVAERKQIKPEVGPIDNETGRPRLRWNRDNFHFTYEKSDRGHQRFRIIEINSHDGAQRCIIDEKSNTFINDMYGDMFKQYLDNTDEIIYMSEMDGWKQLYLIDAKAGKIKNQITKGEFVVRGVDLVDEAKRQIWFRACGMNHGQDPYLMHYYRVNFDGTGLTALTEGDGNHTVEYSPDYKYLIDTYGRVDLPPVNELRRVADGKLVCALEKADVTESGWTAPEVFTAKARDGKTDIWGIICRPKNIDPNKKYAILEDIYAGPQDSFVPKTFSAAPRYKSLTDLGFIVVKMDGMGTRNRSKAFHDYCFHNIKDAGFPDRILWMKAAAAKYPYMDITRVGVYGTSAGGQNAAAALEFHPEFYKVAVANSGCHDNRMDKSSWNEQWMGYPVGPWYGESSNIDNAWRLKGHLFLIVGEVDTNVPPESTYRFCDALIKAGKDFDLLTVPNANHGAAPNPATRDYVQRRLADYFVRYLQHADPPERNG